MVLLWPVLTVLSSYIARRKFAEEVYEIENVSHHPPLHITSS